MRVKNKAIEMFGELIVPSEEKSIEVNCDMRLLDKHVYFVTAKDYESPFISFGIAELVHMYERIGQYPRSHSSDNSDEDDDSNEEDAGVPVVSEELYLYTESLMKVLGEEFDHSKVATFAKAIELVAFDYAYEKCSITEDHKAIVKRCKENLDFIKFFKEYVKGYDKGDIIPSKSKPEIHEQNVSSITIQYGKGPGSNSAKMPLEWLELFVSYVKFYFEGKAMIKIDDLLNEMEEQAEAFLSKYSRESVKHSDLIRSYALKLDGLLKDFGIKKDLQRHDIIGDVFGVLKIYPGREKTINNEAAQKRFRKANADKVQKAIKRSK